MESREKFKENLKLAKGLERVIFKRL